jgi:hypothetical protein
MIMIWNKWQYPIYLSWLTMFWFMCHILCITVMLSAWWKNRPSSHDSHIADIVWGYMAAIGYCMRTEWGLFCVATWTPSLILGIVNSGEPYAVYRKTWTACIRRPINWIYFILGSFLNSSRVLKISLFSSWQQGSVGFRRCNRIFVGGWSVTKCVEGLSVRFWSAFPKND